MTGDAVEVAPHVFKVVEDNDRVRVLEYKADPGESSEMHSHPDHVVITLTAGKFRYTTADGDTIEVELDAGQAVFSGAVDHRGENIGDLEATGFVVELK